MLIQALISVNFAERWGLGPRDVFDHRAWILFYIVINGVLGQVDEIQLRRAGLKVRGAFVVSAFLVPLCIFASCRTIKRQANRSAWVAYMPLLLWLLSLAGSIFLSVTFDPDAPLLFRPEDWF